MTRRNLAWGAAFIIPAILALAWLPPPVGPAPEQTGGVRIAASAPTPAAAVASTAAMMPVPPKRIPIVATQKDVDLADDQSYRVTREKRDHAWADRSEAAIRNLMQGLNYIGGKRRLDIKCAASVCEVVGIADPDPATNSYKLVWEALERDTASDELGKFGLQRSAAIFDTGRNPDEFKIQYSRVKAPPTP